MKSLLSYCYKKSSLRFTGMCSITAGKKSFIDSVKCCLIINGNMLFDLDILIGNLEIIEIKFDMIPIPSKTLDIEDVAHKKKLS